MTLDDYLSACARKPVEYGAFDCLLYLADWVLWQKGVDVAGRWRGRYHCEREASRLMSHYGGMEALIDFAVKGVLVPTETPAAGDIAIVRPHGARELGGAIRTTTGFAVLKRHGGLWTAQHRQVAAWSLV